MANAAYVSTGKPNVSGAIYYAEAGTELPDSASATLDNAFVALGYVSDDGLTNENSPESDTVKAWGGDTVLSMQTDREDTFSFTLIEALNSDVLSVIYGADNVTDDGNGNITITATADELDEGSWVIDMILKGGRAKRIVIPAAKVSSVDTISYKDDEAVGYGITITCVPDEDGVYHYEYITGTTASV